MLLNLTSCFRYGETIKFLPRLNVQHNPFREVIPILKSIPQNKWKKHFDINYGNEANDESKKFILTVAHLMRASV
jgi:hypothetical protein